MDNDFIKTSVMRGLAIILFILFCVNCFAQTPITLADSVVVFHMPNNDEVLEIAPPATVYTKNDYTTGNAIRYFSGNGTGNGLTGENPAAMDSINTMAVGSGTIMAIENGTEWQGLILAKDGCKYIPYGEGSAPILNGASDTVIGWTQIADSTYQATVTGRVVQVLSSDTILPVSRFPNLTGVYEDDYIFIDSVVNDTTVICSDLIGIDWTGSTALLRLVGWSFEAIEVVGCDSTTGRINLETVPEYAYAMGETDPFIMLNKYEALDLPEHWVHNEANSKLIVKTEDGQEPSNITYSQLSYGISGNVDNVEVYGLVFKNYESSGAYFELSNDVTVKNCTFTNNYANGVTFGKDMTTTGNQAIDNTVSGSNQNGISGRGDNMLFQGNNIRDIALIENVSIDGLVDFQNVGNGINIYRADSSMVKENIVTNIGYNGIMVRGFMDSIMYNVVDSGNMTLNDGGNFYVHDSCTGTVFSYNISRNSGANVPDGNFSHGYYADALTDGVIFEYNTAYSNQGYGMLIHECERVTARNNTCFQNYTHEVYLASRFNNPMFDNHFNDNILFCTTASPKKTMQWFQGTINTLDFTLSDNIFGSPDTDNIFYVNLNYNVYEYVTIAQLQDSISQTGIGTMPTVSNYANAELFVNETDSTQYYDLSNYTDLDGVALTNNEAILKYSSFIAIRNE